MVSPSKLKRPPAASPTKNLVLLSDGLFPCTKNPLLVPVIPVGLGFPAYINPPSLELIKRLLADNLNTSTSIVKTEAVTLISSDLIFTTSPSKNM